MAQPRRRRSGALATRSPVHPGSGIDSATVHEGRDESEALRRFEETLELVEIVARQIGRLIGGAVELDDLRSFGREGLLDAARRYDPTRGVPFRAYANYRVRGAIYDGTYEDLFL